MNWKRRYSILQTIKQQRFLLMNNPCKINQSISQNSHNFIQLTKYNFFILIHKR